MVGVYNVRHTAMICDYLYAGPHTGVFSNLVLSPLAMDDVIADNKRWLHRLNLVITLSEWVEEHLSYPLTTCVLAGYALNFL